MIIKSISLCLDEVKLILSLFPKFDKKKILFTPNFAPRSEYEEGFSLGVNVTLDNMHPLINWGDTFKVYKKTFF